MYYTKRCKNGKTCSKKHDLKVSYMTPLALLQVPPHVGPYQCVDAVLVIGNSRSSLLFLPDMYCFITDRVLILNG